MSNICKNWSQWLKESRFSYMSDVQFAQTLNWLNAIADVVLNNAEIRKGDKIIDIGTGTGLLAFKAMEMLAGEGEVIFSDKFEDCLNECQKILNGNNVTSGYSMLLSPCEKIELKNDSVDKALIRSVLVHIIDKQQCFDEIHRILKPNGIFSAFEPVISSNTKYYELVNPENITDYNDFKSAEKEMMNLSTDSLTNFDENSLAKNIENAGFKDGKIDLQEAVSEYVVQKSMVDNWFATPPSPGAKTMKERFMQYFDEQKVDRFIEEIKLDLDNKSIKVKSKTAFIKAVK